MKNLIRFLLFAVLMCSTAAHAIDLTEVEKLLTSTGAEGWVHGDVADRSLFAFTFRNPENFFDYVIVSLVPETTEVRTQLQSLGRHDRVRIKGVFIMPNNPQKHVKVTAVEVVTKFQSKYPSEHYGYEGQIPDELYDLGSALFLVHAIGADGHILVVEYKDQVVPVPVKKAELTKNLYRNDLVRLKFKVRDEPEQPSHLRLDESAPIEVVESIKAKHGQTVTREGALVMFPQSPEIKFNVFALQEELPEGLKRQYTLVNFTSVEAFQKIREVLQKAWDKYPDEYVNGRNKLVSKKIRVKVTGIFNEVDANQANAQILLVSADSIQLVE